MDRPDDVGVPALEATQRQWPQGAKVNHFMTRGIGVWQHAREALVACSEFVKFIARDGDEAPPRPEDSLTRTWTREDEDMESVIQSPGPSLFLRHRHPIRAVRPYSRISAACPARFAE